MTGNKLSTIKCQRESDRSTVCKVHKTTALLPSADDQFEEVAHDRAAVALQDGRLWLGGFACRKIYRGDNLAIYYRRVIVCRR